MKMFLTCLKKLSCRKDYFPNAVILFLAVALLFIIFNVKYWKQETRVINWDVLEYYSYLPAVFIHKDISLAFTDADPAYFSGRFWPHQGPKGSLVLKMSMGMSVLYAPFFLGAHAFASMSRHFVADGFSPPYHLALLLGGVFYLLLGLIFLKKVLVKYFLPSVVAVTLFITVAGTNLFFYASFEAAMSHAYSFGLFAAFLFFTISWHEVQSLKKSIILGILTGLITLVRPSNAVILLFFIFYGISNRVTLLRKLGLLLEHSHHLLLMGLISVFVWLPQLFYWKHLTGEWLYWSYGDQGFFFGNPQLMNGLFSFRKGWFIYTPMMLLAVTGVFLLRKQFKDFFLPLIIFLTVNVYIVLSWWCWWYGGSFGLRAFIESYALLAIPLAKIAEKISQARIWRKTAGFLLIAILTIHSLFQGYQYHYGSIHWDSMTRAAWLHSFGKLKPGKNLRSYLIPPDYEKAKKGIPEYHPFFERQERQSPAGMRSKR